MLWFLFFTPCTQLQLWFKGTASFSRIVRVLAKLKVINPAKPCGPYVPPQAHLK